MKNRKAASLSSGLLARKGDAAPASTGEFESTEPDEIPPFAKENDVSPDFVSPGLDAAGANAPRFGSSDPHADDEIPLVYTDGDGEHPKVGTVLQPLPRFDAGAYLQDAHRRRRRRRQARWIAGTFLIAAVAGFGAISLLGQGETLRLSDTLDRVADGFSDGLASIVVMVQGESGQEPRDAMREPGTEQGSGTAGLADQAGDDIQVAIAASQGAERGIPQKELPTADAAIESPPPDSGLPPPVDLESPPADGATPGAAVARGRNTDVRVESASPTLGIAEAGAELGAELGAEPGTDIGMKEAAVLSMKAVAIRSPALGPNPLKLMLPSLPPARLALAATVVALTRPPTVPKGRAQHPPAANVAKILSPATTPDPVVKSVALEAPVSRSRLADIQDPIDDVAATGRVTGVGAVSVAEGDAGDGEKPRDGEVILGTTVIAAQTASHAMPDEEGVADIGDRVATAASPDGNLKGEQILSLAAIRSPQSKPVVRVRTPPSSSIASGGSRRNYVVQLLSVTTEEGAAQELAKIMRRFPDLLDGLGVTVHRVELTDRGSRFRVRTAPFGNKADAEAFCSKLKDLKQDCLIYRL